MEKPSETINKIKRNRSEQTIRKRNQDWFNKLYFERETDEHKYIEKHTGGFKFVVGKVYTFLYFDPKYKEELDFYNAVPVGIFFGWRGKNPMFLGLQFIPPKIRIEILDRITELNNSSIDQANDTIARSQVSTRKLKATYADLQEILKKSGFEFAIREYIIGRIKTKPLIVTYVDWWRLCTFSGQFMMKKHIAYIYYQYKLKMGVNQFKKGGEKKQMPKLF